MTREEFVDNYLASLDVVPFNKEDYTTKLILEMIGSIYDLQQQIKRLQKNQKWLEGMVYCK